MLPTAEAVNNAFCGGTSVTDVDDSCCGVLPTAEAVNNAFCGATSAVARPKEELVAGVAEIKINDKDEATSTVSRLNFQKGSSPGSQLSDLSTPKQSVASADEFKGQGNKFFQQKRYADAVDCYSKAINCCPPGETSKLSVYYQNCAAVYKKMDKWNSVVQDFVGNKIGQQKHQGCNATQPGVRKAWT